MVFLLVPQVSPGSVVDGGNGANIPSAQHQRRLNTSQQLCEPDGAPCGQETEVEVKICEFSADDENRTIPVFTISEEDDREPLVSAEHQDQEKNNVIRNHQYFPSFGSAHSAFTNEESAVLKNTSGKLRLPC